MLKRIGGWLVIGIAASVTDGYAQTPISLPPVPGAPVGVVAFVDVGVVPMDRERVLARQTVLVSGGRIVALGPAGKIQVPPRATRIDGRGRYLMPGLADMHVHLNLPRRTIRDTVEFARLDSIDAERRLLELLAQGITTVRNMDYISSGTYFGTTITVSGDHLLRLRERAAAGKLLSPRIYTSGPWAPSQYLLGTLRNAPQPRMDSIAAYVATYQAAGYDFLKIRSEIPAIFDSVTAAARRLGLPVVGHGNSGILSGSAQSEWVLKAGYTSVEHVTEAYGLAGHPSDSILAALAVATKRAGLWNCPTIAYRLKTTFLGRNDAVEIGRFVRALQDAGAGLLLGTDYPDVLGWRVTAYQELQTLIVVARLTPYEALSVATRNAATYLHTLDQTGTVAVGKRADLVLLGGNPLINIGHLSRPDGVMVGGRWRTRADLDQHLAAYGPEPAPQEKVDWEYQRDWRYLDDVRTNIWKPLSGSSPLTKSQMASLEQLTEVHNAERQALTDSLRSSAEDVARRRRVLRLLGRQLREIRTVLTPSQLAIFDRGIRRWRGQLP